MADVSFTIEAIDKATGAISGIRGAILTMNQAVQLAGQVYQAVNRVIEATVNEYVKYADQVRRLSQLNGTNAEETSRLIQVTDDYKISVEALNMATRKLSGEGLSLTTENLATMSDEFLMLGTNAEKTKFLLDNFGRTGTQFAEIMMAGGDAIRSQSTAVEKGLVLTEEATKAARDYEKALDANADQVMALKVALGQYLLPALVSINSFILSKSIPGWQEVGKTFDIIGSRMISKSWEISAGIKNALDLTGDSAGAGLIDWFFGRQGGIERSYTEWATNMYNSTKMLPPVLDDLAAAEKAAADELDRLAEISRSYMGIINGTAPSLEAMGAAAYEAALASDGLFSSMDALASVRLKEELGLITEAEAKAMVMAINFRAALDALAGMHVTVTVDMIGSLIQGISGGSDPVGLAGYVGRGGQIYGDQNATAAPAASTAYWIPDPSNPGHYIKNPGRAAGGYVSGRYAITGDSLDGRRTGYEELVDFQTKHVYSAPQTRAMGAVPGYAGGSGGEMELSQNTINRLADALSFKLQPYL